jgi:type I restriction enzyme S subunit
MSELYTLPDGWEWKNIEELCEILDRLRKPISQKDRISGEYPYYGATGIVDYIDNYIFDERLLLIGEDGAKWGANENTAFIAEGKYWVNNHAHIMRPKKDFVIDSLLIYYLNTTDLMEYITGATVKKLNQEKLKSINIPLPPLEEQKRIVAKLDNLFAKIDKAIALHQKNIDEANVFMASVLNDVFVELEEKYEKKQLSEIVIFGGKNISTLEYPNLIYFSLEDIEAQTGRILNCKTVNEAGVKGTAVRFDENVVLYSKLRPYLNKVIVPNLEGCSTTELVVLKPKDKLDKYFLASYLRSSNIVNFLNNDSMGAKMPRTNMKTFRNLEISFPPYETQQKVVSYLDEISQKMEKIKQIQKEKMQSLKALKASILDQAFRGEL